MALIKCPECGGQVSDKAPACIHCGYPLQEIVSKSTCIINYAEQDVTDIKNIFCLYHQKISNISPNFFNYNMDHLKCVHLSVVRNMQSFMKNGRMGQYI